MNTWFSKCMKNLNRPLSKEESHIRIWEMCTISLIVREIQVKTPSLLKWLLFKRKQTLVAFLKGFILLIEVYISTIGRNIANMENIFQLSQKKWKIKPQQNHWLQLEWRGSLRTILAVQEGKLEFENLQTPGIPTISDPRVVGPGTRDESILETHWPVNVAKPATQGSVTDDVSKYMVENDWRRQWT